jgi:hypothetical protein
MLRGLNLTREAGQRLALYQAEFAATTLSTGWKAELGPVETEPSCVDAHVSCQFVDIKAGHAMSQPGAGPFQVSFK